MNHQNKYPLTKPLCINSRRKQASQFRASGIVMLVAMSASPVVYGEEGLWRYCTTSPIVDFSSVADVSVSGEVAFSADQVEVTGTQYYLKGSVTGGGSAQQLSADSLIYNKESELAQAEGKVRYSQKGRVVTGESAELNLSKDTGSIRQAQFWIKDKHIRGMADVVHIDGPLVMRLESGLFTTCEQGNTDWVLKASRLRLDAENNEAIAHDARVDFMNVPIFYFPYLSFPLQGRKSGLLVPSFGSSSDSGNELSLPYYWNIAPHRDATLTAQIMSRRGVLLDGEFRYLNERNHGQLDLAYISNDRVYGDNRSAVNFQHAGNPLAGWRTRIEYRSISDGDYMDDFGSALAESSSTHLERRADIDYSGQYLQAKLLFQAFQTVDTNLSGSSRPYQRLPQLQLNSRDWKSSQGLMLGLGFEAVHFDRKEDVVGTRLDVQPRISWPVRGDSGFIIPKVTFRHTQYQLQNSSLSVDNSPTRSLPLMSLDSGIVFERELNNSGLVSMQTLEPRLFYLRVPYRNQTRLIVDESGTEKVFDTSLPLFSLSQMFRENRFIGGDRVGDANQLTSALTTRFLDKSGRELLSASIGRIYYFSDRNVTLPGEMVEQDSVSDWMTEVKSRWSKALTARVSLQINAQSGKMQRGSTDIRYQKDSRRVLRLAYRYEKDSMEQSDVALIWPLSANWNWIGRWLYDLRGQGTLEALKGIEYESCCWAVRIVQRNYKVNVQDDEDNEAIWFQLELKGLTSVGKQVKSLLARDILLP